MSEAVALLPPREVFEQRTVGLILNGEPTLDEWLAFGLGLGAVHGALPWAVGDWLLAGERFGEMASQALGEHYSPETLQTYKRVCQAIPLSRRRESLTFGHYQAVYKLPEAEREELLDLSEHGEWTRSALRAEIERRHPVRKIGAIQPEPAPEIESPQTVEEAIDMLTSLPAGALPEHIMDAVILLIDEVRGLRLRD